MNEISSANETLNTIQSPPRRRRSTFFEKRESIVPQTSFTGDVLEDNAGTALDVEKYTQHLTNYYDLLSKEKEQWKLELRERRSEYKDLKLQLTQPRQGSSKTIDYALLTDEDIHFLKGKPNVKKISEDCLNFHKSILNSMHMCKRWQQLNRTMIEHCESRINKIYDNILEHSTIDMSTSNSTVNTT